MGCCTRFHRTWWPGYTSEEIDVNKAFDFQRRLNIAKKVIGALILLATFACIIYFLATYFTGGSSEVCPTNGTQVNGTHNVQNVTKPHVESQPETQALNQATILAPPFVDHVIEPPTSSPSPNPVEHNVQTTEANDSTNQGQIETIDSNDVNPELKENDASIVHQNETVDEMVIPSPSWCPSRNLIDCIGLSKTLRTITTFKNNKTKTVNRPVEGYIMVRNEKWHPYCREDWSLDMGYKLCNSLGFLHLIRLNHIPVFALEQRVKGTRKNITVIGKTETGSEVDKGKCRVGYISCK